MPDSARNTANLAWDDGHLWTDDDAAAFLRITVSELEGVIAAGAPALAIPGVAGRRWAPEELRDWSFSYVAMSPTAMPRHTRPARPAHVRVGFGSGFTRSTRSTREQP